jgi:hypothetical protein
MAINPVILLIEFNPAPPQSPALSEWTVVGDPDNYLDLADPLNGEGYLVNPAGITSETRQIFSRGFIPATTLELRMRYGSDPSPPTAPPTVRVFGRARFPNGTPGPWRVLTNRAGEAAGRILGSVADIVASGGTFLTSPTPECLFDVAGCNEFLVGVQEAGNVGIGGLQVRFG